MKWMKTRENEYVRKAYNVNLLPDNHLNKAGYGSFADDIVVRRIIFNELIELK